MNLTDQLIELFHTCFPTAVRNPETLRKILSDPGNKVLTRYDGDKLMAALVLNGNTVYMLAVLPEYRKQGVGSALLSEAEAICKAAGYDAIVIGAGKEYLTPGVPTSEKEFEETLKPENIDPGVTTEGADFFKKLGYTHSWGDCNCFDMRFPLEEMPEDMPGVGDRVDGITYRWATLEDLPGITACTDDAEESFTKYYQNPALYTGTGDQRVLVALENGKIIGNLMVSFENEGPGRGSVGCTAVVNAARGRHIGVNMTRIGTRALKEAGLREGFLGYTYSGLDRMYGYAGYKICVYYMMAKKPL